MLNKPKTQETELICTIVNYGMGSKITKIAKQHGISGGTITLGKGTASSKILDFIGLGDIKKEIVFMMADKDTARNALEILNREFEFDKPNHGIVFTTSVCAVMGTRSNKCYNIKNGRGADNTMYHAITTIVDKGRAEDVIDAATRAGSKGGTIINARGSGIHETSKVFAMDIEPEKEIVIILSEADKTEEIASSIRTSLKIDEPGNGIIYIQDVNKTYGIYK
jgi:nitrogen regulatory protein PII